MLRRGRRRRRKAIAAAAAAAAPQVVTNHFRHAISMRAPFFVVAVVVDYLYADCSG